MKKILAMALIVTTVLSVVACGGKKTVGDNVTTPTNMENSTQEPTNAVTPTATADSTAIANQTASVTATATAKPGSTTTPTATVKPGTTATPTATINPTATVKPTATASSSVTAKPTAVPTPTPTPMFSNVKVGDTILFGTYEQDNKTSNGKEKIEWIVLDIKDGKAFVISKYALDAMSYHNEDWVNVTWSNCNLRNWMNNDFINTAFTTTEKAMISTVTLSGETSQDRIFLLSDSESKTYFSNNNARTCYVTEYADARRTGLSTNGPAEWWLRTKSSNITAAYIGINGSVNKTNGYSITACLDVRPAMWIDISK